MIGTSKAGSWVASGLFLLSVSAAFAVQEGQLAATAETAEASAEPHVRLGLALRELGRNDEAIDAFRQALAVNPSDTAARINLGALLADDGAEEGLEHLREVVNGNPDDSWGHYELAEALRQFGRWDEALEHYERLVALDPGHQNGRVGEAEALTAVGRFADSQAKAEAVLAEFPASRGAKFGLVWLLAASPDLALRDGERAVTLADELFAEKRSLGALELVAAARAEAGRCDEAAQIQRSVVSESMHHDRPAEATTRLTRAAEWYSADPCGAPPGRPADERPLWPRSRPTEDAPVAPQHDH